RGLLRRADDSPAARDGEVHAGRRGTGAGRGPAGVRGDVRIDPTARRLGRRTGRAKARASAANGVLGGRPPEDPEARRLWADARAFAQAQREGDQARELLVICLDRLLGLTTRTEVAQLRGRVSAALAALR